MKTPSRRSATAGLLVHAGLFLTVLLAVTLSDFGLTARAQSPNLQDQLEQVLRLAALDGQIERVRASLDQGAAPDAIDPDGRTALMMAAYNGHTETVKMLLDCGARVDATDRVGRTALMYAASGPFAATVQLLITREAEPNIRDTEEGFTALMFAAAEGQVEVIKVLLSHGADVTIKDNDGDRALDFAVKNGHKIAAGLLKKEAELKPDSKNTP
jgi:ankyrin repeat protein